MARKATDICLRVLKERNNSMFDSYSRQEQCIDHIPLPFGIDACTFLPTTFLEIAVWFKTPACRRQPAGFFQPWPRSWTRDCRETFPVSGQSSIQTQEIRITRLTRRLLGHAAPRAKSRGALGHAAPSLQKRSTSSCKHKKQIFLRKSVRRQTYFHHPISRLHNP